MDASEFAKIRAGDIVYVRAEVVRGAEAAIEGCEPSIRVRLGGVHAVAYDEAGQPLATGRLLPDGHIGRMAVRKAGRGKGVGGAVLQALIQAARERGDGEVILNAQTHAEGFYNAHGFAREGEEFMEAGIPHITMRAGLRQQA